MSRWNFLPTYVSDSLAEELLIIFSEFRRFFTAAAQTENWEVRDEYEYLIDLVRACFGTGFLLWVKQLEYKHELVLSDNYRTSGMFLSRSESRSFLLEQTEQLAPRTVANFTGKTATDLSFLRLEVARRIHRARSREAKQFLWALHKLISKSIRALIGTRVFFHFPNTPHGERFTEDVTCSVAEGLFSEFKAIQRFRAPLNAGLPRDLLSQLLGDPLFQVFADNWGKLRFLTAYDVNRWLETRYPIHRRSLPARIAAAVGRAGVQSYMLRVQLAKPWELDDRAPFSIAENVGDIFTHTLLRTGALECFPN